MTRIKKKAITIFILILTINLFGQGDENKTLWTVAWSPNGEHIAAGGSQGGLKLFDGSTFELIRTYEINDVILSRIKWHPTENKLAVVTQSETFKAKILDLDQNSWTELTGLENSFRGLDWNQSGELLAVSDLHGAVYLFDSSGKMLSKFDADPKGAAGLDWHPQKDILVCVGSQISMYYLDGDSSITWVPKKKERFLLCVEWHRSGDFFVVGDYGDLAKAENKLLQFWDMDGEMMHEITGSVGEYRNIRWSPDGKQLASASDALRIWSSNGDLLAESASSEDYLWGIDWSPDGKTIITSSSTGVIALWNTQAERIKEIEYP